MEGKVLMKWLKKLKLVNWHYFKDEDISFGKQTMITGRNAAGKSTIIDALQVLFIANLTMIRFNSSAHDDAKRSLKSYLRGKIGSDDRKHIREGDFTTFLMAEFYDEAKEDYFVVGTVIDVYRDDNIVQEYFIVDRCQIDDLEYVKGEGNLKNRDEFHRYIERLNKRYLLERTKEGYQKALLHRMGQVNNRFFSTFSKALSFKPIQNVRDFVYDYILDEKELQLDIMKENFEVHQKYKKELEELVVRQDSLKQISDIHTQYEKFEDTVKQQDYVIRQLELMKQQEVICQLTRNVNDINEKIEKAEKEKLHTELALEDGKNIRTEAYRKWQSNQEKQREEQLRESINKKSSELQGLRKELVEILLTLKKEKDQIRLLAVLPENGFWKWEQSTPEVLNQGAVLLESIIDALEAGSSSDADLSSLGKTLSGLHSQFVIKSSEVGNKTNELAARRDGLLKEVKDLENEKRKYPEPVQNLKNLLEIRLEGRSEVWIFCEEMEIQNEGWRNAIEGYLNNQKFDLLVDPEFFEEALQIYEAEKWNVKLEGAGLVNTKKEKAHLGTLKESSLATEVVSGNPVVQARIDHLMGRVIKADSEKELSKHQAAITASCMLYQNLVARQIKQERYRIPFIGSKAIPRQLELKKEELKEIIGQMQKLQAYKILFQKWENHLADVRSRYERLNSRQHLPQVIAEIRNEVEGMQLELEQMDFSGIMRLKEDYEYWDKKVQEIEGEIIELKAQIGISTNTLTHEKEKLTQSRNGLLNFESRVLEWQSAHSITMLQQAEERLKEARNQDIPLEKKLENWNGNKAGNKTRADNEFDKLRRSRHNFNIKHHFNGNEEATDNRAYQHLLDQIDLNMDEYQEKLEIALKQSEEEFASHFVYKMKEAIEGARRQFRLLNESLKQFPFNEESYQFELTASDKYKRFYDVIMSLSFTDKDTIFDLEDEEQNHTLHELFEILTKGDSIDQEEFTDYRHYLDFDLMITTSTNSRIRFSTVLKEKSGGETQTPFYIAILSSFNQLYSSRKTMRLVVFDEAFNKMDEERIQTSLRLIKNMDFQLIAAVPDEKLSNMAKEVSSIVIVHREGYECFTDTIEYKPQVDGGEKNEPRANEPVSVQDSLFTS